MIAFWKQANLSRRLGLWVLCIWLVLVGLILLLGLGSPALSLLMNMAAIATGVLLFLQR